MKGNTMDNKIKELEELVQALSWNDGYGCYTRAGFEKLIWPTIAEKAKWIIFFDIDDMHTLNEQHGYDGTNTLIRESLKMRDSDYMAGQWFSGDEFIIAITDDHRDSNAFEFCERLAVTFRENGAPATFAIAPVQSDLMSTVLPAQQLCQQAKEQDRRGTINLV
jgi:GGDEF domain-containing protein